MSVAKARGAYSFTQREKEGQGGGDPCAHAPGGVTLRGVDAVGVERAASIVVPVYVDRLIPLDIPLRSYAPQPVRRRRLRPRPALREQFSIEQRERLRLLDLALTDACAVFARSPMPRPSERMAMAWQFTRVNPFTDYVPDKVQTRPSLPTGAAVDRAARVFEVVFALKAEDEFAAYLVVARASFVPWKKILAIDPKGRARGRLVVHRDNALARMLELAAERRLSIL